MINFVLLRRSFWRYYDESLPIMTIAILAFVPKYMKIWGCYTIALFELEEVYLYHEEGFCARNGSLFDKDNNEAKLKALYEEKAYWRIKN